MASFYPILYHPDFDLELDTFGIEIPLLDHRAQTVFKTLVEKLNKNLTYFSPGQCPLITREDYLRVHEKKYIEEQVGETLIKHLETSFELSERYNPLKAKRGLADLLKKVEGQVAGTYQGLLWALEHGQSYFLGGGMHHAMSFAGRGFCHFHDGLIGLRKLQHQGLIETAWVIDLDAHKGDGTAQITASDGSIKTLSIHMKNGWPLDGPKLASDGQLNPWFIPSDKDIELESGEEALYLSYLNEALKNALREWSRPDVVWVVDGSDAYEGDILPSAQGLRLNKDQMLERSLLVHNFFKTNHIPQAYVFGGGYGSEVASIHSQFILKMFT